jgi:short-subunit dehydrogenase
MQSLRDATIVITGASSGIGTAVVQTFACRGARVALAARCEAALTALARECEALGGQAVAVSTDVSNLEAVQRLAQVAAERLVSIRVWINNAGVGAVGRFTDTPMQAHRRVIETNLLAT